MQTKFVYLVFLLYEGMKLLIPLVLPLIYRFKDPNKCAAEVWGN